MMIFVMKNSVQTWLFYGERDRIPYTLPIPQLDAIVTVIRKSWSDRSWDFQTPKNVHPRKLTYPHELSWWLEDELSF